MFRGRNSNRGGGRSGGFKGTFSPRPKGQFIDGVWHCNCEPRLPAEHFRVRKEGKNHGRWFYTCQKSDPLRCDFFLWDEDAKPREEAAVLANSRTEPQAVGRGTSARPARDAQHTSSPTVQGRSVQWGIRTATPSPPPPYTAALDVVHSKPEAGFVSRKRRLPWQEEDADNSTEYGEPYPWPPTGEEEQESTETVNRMHATETPRKSVKTDAFATPGSVRQTGLPTPSTSRSFPSARQPVGPPFNPGPFNQPNFTKLEASPSDRIEPRSSSPTTPLPPRFADPPEHLPASPSSATLQSEVATLLFANDISLPPDVHTSLRSILHKYELRMSGLARGRDAVRLSIKAKDARIAEMQARIEQLEAEKETDRAMLGHIRRSREKFDI